jgi:hypothetical protein
MLLLLLLLRLLNVGSDLDQYVAKAVELSVTGFKSSRWAVRNSSMMVFAAVVQRALDNEKNDSGGARAATTLEFFSRFPGLFPFLLSELAAVTGYEVEFKSSWPHAVRRTASSPPVSTGSGRVAKGSHQGGLHPSLYPILLLLSKLRAAMTGALPLTPKQEQVAETKGLCEANVALFIPLIESCRGEEVQQVRFMAARALTALIPLQSVPQKASSVVAELVQTVQGEMI